MGTDSPRLDAAARQPLRLACFADRSDKSEFARVFSQEAQTQTCTDPTAPTPREEALQQCLSRKPSGTCRHRRPRRSARQAVAQAPRPSIPTWRWRHPWSKQEGRAPPKTRSSLRVAGQAPEEHSRADAKERHKGGRVPQLGDRLPNRFERRAATRNGLPVRRGIRSPGATRPTKTRS